MTDVAIVVACIASVVMWAGLVVIGVAVMRSVLRSNAYVVGQFKTNSGTSLRDAIERLERSAERSEAAAEVIAGDLVIAKATVAGVATDLASAQHRADEITEGSPGEAADAGAQGPKA